MTRFFAAARQICLDVDHAYAKSQCNLMAAASMSACVKMFIRRPGSWVLKSGNGGNCFRKRSMSKFIDLAAASYAARSRASRSGKWSH